MTFVFKLDRLLSLRRSEKKRLQLELASVYAELAGIDERRERLKAAGRQARLSEARLQAALFCESLDRKLVQLEREEDGLCERAALLMVRLREVRTAVEALEKLREKRLDEFEKGLRAGEQVEIDLFAGRRRRSPFSPPA